MEIGYKNGDYLLQRYVYYRIKPSSLTIVPILFLFIWICLLSSKIIYWFYRETIWESIGGIYLASRRGMIFLVLNREVTT